MLDCPSEDIEDAIFHAARCPWWRGRNLLLIRHHMRMPDPIPYGGDVRAVDTHTTEANATDAQRGRTRPGCPDARPVVTMPRAVYDRRPPRLGEHTDELRAWLRATAFEPDPITQTPPAFTVNGSHP